MIGAFVTLVILVLLVTAVIGVFYTYDYYKKNMQEISTKLKNVDSRIDVEQTQRKDRMSKLVSNINTVNSNIGSNLYNTNTMFASLSNGLNSVMRFTSGTNNVPLTLLPGASSPNMNLLSNVNVLGGMNIKDLYYTSATDKKQFTMNGPNGGLITYPDANGRISLSAPLYTDKAVTLDGTTTVNAAMTFNKGAAMGASISAVGTNQGYIQTKSLGLGNSTAPTGPDLANPNASIHIMTTTGETTDAKVPFKISVGNDDVLKMRKSGVIVAKGIYLSPNVNNVTGNANDAASTRIEVTANGELIITPPVINSVPGTLYINGNIRATGKIDTLTGGSITNTAGSPAIALGSSYSYNNNDGFTSGPIPTIRKTRTPVDQMNDRFLLNR